MNHVKSMLLLSVLLCTGFSANAGIVIQPADNESGLVDGKNKTLLLEEDEVQLDLGVGYNSSTYRLADVQCVIGTEVEFGPEKDSVRLLANESVETIRDQLRDGLDVGINRGSFPLNAGGLIDQNSVSGDYSATYSFIYQAESRRRVLLPNTLANQFTGNHYDTSGCQSLFASSDALDIVGDAFVNSILLGGLLKFDLTITAQHKNDIDLLKRHLKIDSGSAFYLDTDAAMQQGVDLSEVQITLRLSQQGGLTERLQQTFGESDLTCVASNWSDCTELYTAAINYALNDFPTQFDNGGDEFVLSYTTVSYRNAKIADIEPLNGADTMQQLAALSYLKGKYDRALSNLNELVVLQANQSEITAVESEISSLESKYEFCQEHHEYCYIVIID